MRKKAPVTTLRNETRFHETWRRLCKSKLAVFGLIFITFIVLVAIFADVQLLTAMTTRTSAGCSWRPTRSSP